MSLLVGSFGPDHTTAGWIALSYMHLSFMPAVGFSVAVTSLVGKYIGAKRPDVAVSRARLGIGMSMVYMTICAAIFVNVIPRALFTQVNSDSLPIVNLCDV